MNTRKAQRHSRGRLGRKARETIRRNADPEGAAGFTLGEMLLALAIVALLLASVAVAMKGALVSYAENAKIAEVTQAARVIVNRMLTEIRTADAVVTSSQQVTITPPANADGVTRIIYELSSGTLYYRRTVNGSEEWNTLIASDETLKVQSLAVVRQTALDGDGQTYTTSVNARLVLQAANEPLFISASACPRRTQSY